MASKLNAFDNLNFETITANKPEYKQVEWNSIQPDITLNIREEEKYTDDPELHELAYSIIKFGLRQPVVLYKDKNKKNAYFIWHGQRRFSAIKLIQSSNTLNYFLENQPYKITEEDKENLLRIPCIILPEPEDKTQRILRQIAENEHRKEVDNLELCKQYHELLKSNNNWTQDILAEKIGKSKQLVSDICGLKRIDNRIQKLISEIQLYGYTIKALEENKLTPSSIDNTLNKKIGIKTLRKIASSKEQNITFWDLFASKCSNYDADFIDLVFNNTKEEKNINKFDVLNTNYNKLTKKISTSSEKNSVKYHNERLEVAKQLISLLMEENKLTKEQI